MQKNNVPVLVLAAMLAATSILPGAFYDFGLPPAEWQIPEALSGSLYAQIYGASRERGPEFPGATLIHPWSLYTPEQGYGFIGTPTTMSGRPYVRNNYYNPVYHDSDSIPLYNLICDGLYFYAHGDRQSDFRIDLPPGDYMVTLYLGDMNVGEGRPNQSVAANGHPFLDRVSVGAGQVGAFSGKITLPPESPLVLTFGLSNNTAVTGLAVTPCTPETAVPPVSFIPERAELNLAAAQANINRFVEREKSIIQTELDALRRDGCIGPDLTLPPHTADATGIYATMFGDVSRLANLCPGLDVSAITTMVREIGFTGIGLSNPEIMQKYAAAGLQVSTGIHAEVQPPTGKTYPPQILRRRDGSEHQLPGFFAIHAPEVQADFRHIYDTSKKESAPFAHFIFVDEPRGMTCTGGYLGDYSETSRKAFADYCQNQNLPPPDADGAPMPAYSDAFHAFFRFRFDSVPRFILNSCAGTCIEALPKLAGNGDIGPLNVNHNCFYPPAFAAAGMTPASWCYVEPALAKIAAETMRACGREMNRDGAVFTRVGNQHENIERHLGLAVLSARNSCLGPREGHNARLITEFAALARRLAGTEPDGDLYLYWPESLTYPDLIHWNQAVATAWTAYARALFAGNINFKLCFNPEQLPPSALLVFVSPEPVLSPVELARLLDFLRRGGRLQITTQTPLRQPNGTPYPAPFANSAPGQVELLTAPLTPTALRAAADRGDFKLNRELPATLPLSSWSFTHLGRRERLLLLFNAGTETATVTPPPACRDAFTGTPLSAPLPLPPGLFRLLTD